MGQIKKVYIYSNGCIENLLDGKKIKKFFNANGWKLTDDYQDADLILINACAVTEEIENVSINKIRRLQHISRTAELVVGGCLPRINKERLDSVFNGNIFTTSLQELESIFNSTVEINRIDANYLEKSDCVDFAGTSQFQKNILVKIEKILRSTFENFNIYFYPYFEQLYLPLNKYYIKITTGCIEECSFCATRRARGDLKSKSIAEIEKEFLSGLQKGYKYFMLTGTDIGPFGKDIDLGLGLVVLLKRLLRKEGDYLIGLRNIHPRWFIFMFDKLLPIFKSGRINYLCSPVESGNDYILNKMGRNHNIEDYKKCIFLLRKSIPTLIITTHIIVGFPSETEERFNDTLNLINEISFDDVLVTKYSERPNTPAANYDHKIPENIKRIRYKKLYRKVVLSKLRASLLYFKKCFLK